MAEMPQSLIAARMAIARAALQLANHVNELQAASAMLDRFIRLAGRGGPAPGANADAVLKGELLGVKTSIERVAARLVADADLRAPLALLGQALAEIVAGDAGAAITGMAPVPMPSATAARAAPPSGQVFHQQPYRPPAVARDRARSV